MGKYGEAAVKTVNYLNEHKHDDPIKAWNEVTIKIFGEGKASQKKRMSEKHLFRIIRRRFTQRYSKRQLYQFNKE